MADDIGLPDFLRSELPELPEKLVPSGVVKNTAFQHETLITKDLYLAAAILALRVGELMGVDRKDKRHMKFTFDGNNLTRIQDAWESGECEVNGPDYAHAIRKMKSVIHSED